MKATTCKGCNRVLWEKDADDDGMCPNCKLPEKAKKAKPKWVGDALKKTEKDDK